MLQSSRELLADKRAWASALFLSLLLLFVALGRMVVPKKYGLPRIPALEPTMLND
jgi:hypothetical protein